MELRSECDIEGEVKLEARVQAAEVKADAGDYVVGAKDEEFSQELEFERSTVPVTHNYIASIIAQMDEDAKERMARHRIILNRLEEQVVSSRRPKMDFLIYPHPRNPKKFKNSRGSSRAHLSSEYFRKKWNLQNDQKLKS